MEGLDGPTLDQPFMTLATAGPAFTSRVRWPHVIRTPEEWTYRFLAGRHAWAATEHAALPG